MTENLNLLSFGKVTEEFATEKDKKKAYQIFFLSFIGSVILTTGLYIFATLL